MTNSKSPATEAAKPLLDTVSEVETSKKEVTRRPPRQSLKPAKRMPDIQIPGYHIRYINTRGGQGEKNSQKLAAYMANWWEPVTNKEVYGEGCKNPESFLQLDEAEGQMAVKLPNELYDEDQKIKNAKNIERAKAYAEFHEGGDFGGLKTETKEYK